MWSPSQPNPLTASGLWKPNIVKGWTDKEMKMQDCKVTQFYFVWLFFCFVFLEARWDTGPLCRGCMYNLPLPKTGGPATSRAQAAGAEAPVNAQLQGPRDPKERGGTRRRPGMAQIGGGGGWESREERTQNPRSWNPNGGPVPFLPMGLQVRKGMPNSPPAGGRARGDARCPGCVNPAHQPEASILTEGACALRRWLD